MLRATLAGVKKRGVNKRDVKPAGKSSPGCVSLANTIQENGNESEVRFVPHMRWKRRIKQ